MFSDEETELRDSIIQSLEKCGFLNKIKAELRAGVCLAIEEESKLKNKIPLFNKKFDEFAATTEGKLMLSIIREFLEFFNLHCTLSVFDPEIAIDSPCLSRMEICKQLKLRSDIEGPVISELIKDKIEIRSHKPNANFVADSTLSDNSTSKIGLGFTASRSDANDCSGGSKGILVSSKSGTEMKECKKNELESDLISSKSKTVLDINLPDKPINTTSSVQKNIFKDPNSLSSDHDPFFDEPLPSEKASLFTFSESHKVKPQSKPVLEPLNSGEKLVKNDLSSLKDLPSLTSPSEWTFNRDLKQSFLSHDSQKSVSSSETSNEIINLDKDAEQNLDLDVADSNESSEKPISEESIEEDIDDDDTAGLDEFLNSSSLADDVTTDHSVSQTSVIEGVDYLEPCKQAI